MQIGDLVKILSVFAKEDEKYIGTIGIIKCKPVAIVGIWGVYTGNRTLYLLDDRLEVI